MKANILSESISSPIKRHLAFFKYITIFRLVAPVVQWIGHNPAKIVTPVRLHVYGQPYLGFESLIFRSSETEISFRFFFFLRMLKYERFFYFLKDKHEKRTKNLKFTDDNSPHRSWTFLLMAANPTSRDHYHPSQRC